ncbi:hypothetical protein PR202_ga04442 [Eleusine coracana subsp. coracana]|uniref:Photosystem I iron-sulfur center n=1 Tax=Eleusine coracana subsp. coracana TaxID=191504 RepID=A0AAV5BRK1_ELECO|nr:hypothetical protein PR202_ga04442 [Eleusine coracana subsp. coracana]
MSHSVKIYDTCIGCTQCVRACPTDVLEMIPWDGCKAKQIASAPRTEDCVGSKRCESACPTDFLSVRVYLGPETTRSMSRRVVWRGSRGQRLTGGRSTTSCGGEQRFSGVANMTRGRKRIAITSWSFTAARRRPSWYPLAMRSVGW